MIEELARELREEWDANPNAIHKRPPFAAHKFDTQGSFWVVGATMVSVLHGAHGSREWAEEWAEALNNANPNGGRNGR